jgi:RNA polymerase sigma factor (sigma-70 family)
MAAIDFQGLSDVMLLEQVLLRNQAAWCELLRRYRKSILKCITRIAYSYKLSNDDVDEIFEEVCLNLLRRDMYKLRAYDGKASLNTWFYLIARNTTYDYLRKIRHRPLLDRLDGAPDYASKIPSALDGLLAQEEWEYLNKLLVGFSDKDRRFVELYFVAGLSFEEVAVEMDIDIKTVYSKKFKIHKRLMEHGDRRKI